MLGKVVAGKTKGGPVRTGESKRLKHLHGKFRSNGSPTGAIGTFLGPWSVFPHLSHWKNTAQALDSSRKVTENLSTGLSILSPTAIVEEKAQG